MAFGYIKGTISGTLSGVEGSSKYIKEVSTFMINNLGWQLAEDRTDQAGANHKMILKSNGESGTSSTYYFIMTSGTNNVGLQIATYWDTALHTVGSGVAAPTAATTVVMNTLSQGNFRHWISGDKDSVYLITQRNSNYNGTYVGKIKQITDPTQDHFPICITGDSTFPSNIALSVQTSTQAYSFLNGSTALLSGEVDFVSHFQSPGADLNEAPENAFGYTEGYLCVPPLVLVTDASPVRRAVRGYTNNLWTCVGPQDGSTVSINSEDVFQDTSGKTYQVFIFGTVTEVGIVIRRS